MVMEEQLITFETAKLAKEKGFGGKGLTTSNGYFRGGILCNIPCNNQSDFRGEDEYSAPTQSLLQKWLREEHNIHIEISREYIKGKLIGYDCIIDYEEGIIDLETKSIYEEALEQGLQEALKLIK